MRDTKITMITPNGKVDLDIKDIPSGTYNLNATVRNFNRVVSVVLIDRL